MKKVIYIFMITVMVSSCGLFNKSKTASGTMIGSGAGAVIGAGLGYLFGNNAKSTAIGAAIGTAIGAGTGAVIGKKMDMKAEQLAKLKNAKVETVKDKNGLAAIKVTFESGILFPFNSSNLSNVSKTELMKFASEMSDMKDTDITIYGHTDNKGSESVNQKISQERADAVAAYLQSCGIQLDRMTTKGMSFNQPVADNSTEVGRAKNRRVEIYITANKEMIKKAEAGK